MTTHGIINVKIHRNGEILKNIGQKIQLDKNWTDYSATVKNIQKNVNVSLTELVNLEQSVGETGECESNDEDEEESSKRKRDKPGSGAGRKRVKS